MSKELSPKKPSKGQIPEPNQSISRRVQEILNNYTLLNSHQQSELSQERFPQQQQPESLWKLFIQQQKEKMIEQQRKRFFQQQFSWKKFSRRAFSRQRLSPQQPGPSHQRLLSQQVGSLQQRFFRNNLEPQTFPFSFATSWIIRFLLFPPQQPEPSQEKLSPQQPGSSEERLLGQQPGSSEEKLSLQQPGAQQKKFSRREFSWERFIQQQREKLPEQQPGVSQERFSQQQPKPELSEEGFSQRQHGAPWKKFPLRRFSEKRFLSERPVSSEERFSQQQPGASQERFSQQQPKTSRKKFSQLKVLQKEFLAQQPGPSKKTSRSVASLLPPPRPARLHTYRNIRPLVDEDELYLLRRNITLSEMLLRRDPLFVDAPLPPTVETNSKKQRKPFQEKLQEKNKQEPDRD
ncbi:hypothetical protein DINM_004597 [Dirofilaria immitis]|nr:hypothetical protein [Dirofilaria immitis]